MDKENRTKLKKEYRRQELNSLSSELRMIYYTFEFEGLAAMDKLYYELFEHRDEQRIAEIKLAYKVLGFAPMMELFDKLLLCKHEKQVDELTQVFQNFAPKLKSFKVSFIRENLERFTISISLKP